MTRRRIKVNDVVMVNQPIYTVGPDELVGALGIALQTKRVATWGPRGRTRDRVFGYVLIQLGEHTRERMEDGLLVCTWIRDTRLTSLGDCYEYGP